MTNPPAPPAPPSPFQPQDIDPETGVWRWWTSEEKRGPRLTAATLKALTALQAGGITGPALKKVFMSVRPDPLSPRTAANLIQGLRKYGAICSEPIPGGPTKLYRFGPKGQEVLGYLR